jgi:hypothetical protein
MMAENDYVDYMQNTQSPEPLPRLALVLRGVAARGADQ